MCAITPVANIYYIVLEGLKVSEMALFGLKTRSATLTEFGQK